MYSVTLSGDILLTSAWGKASFPPRPSLWPQRPIGYNWGERRTAQTVKSCTLRAVTGDHDTLLFFKKETHYHMIQKFHFWVYTLKNGKQGLKEILVHSCAQQHYSKQPKAIHPSVNR